jgi:hypothetical protein
MWGVRLLRRSVLAWYKGPEVDGNIAPSKPVLEKQNRGWRGSSGVECLASMLEDPGLIPQHCHKQIKPRIKASMGETREQKKSGEGWGERRQGPNHSWSQRPNKGFGIHGERTGSFKWFSLQWEFIAFDI